MSINFVSISAVSDNVQLKAISRVYQEEKFSLPLVIGYQVSNKSINQGTQNTRQPRFAELGELDKQTRDCGFVTAVHYYTKDNGTIINDLEKVVDLGISPQLTLIQLNTLPPSLDILSKLKEIGFNVIFKVAVSNKQSPQGGYAVWRGYGVEDVSNGSVDPLAVQVYHRREFIDYVMFDPSHGTNLELDLDENALAVRFGKEITSNRDLNHLGFVYAGGIKPSNVKQLTKSLNSFFPNRVSIDVESGVRRNDKLDLDLIRGYLIECNNQ
jgi:phosphoribosylanthranilate isomerase